MLIYRHKKRQGALSYFQEFVFFSGMGPVLRTIHRGSKKAWFRKILGGENYQIMLFQQGAKAGSSHKFSWTNIIKNDYKLCNEIMTFALTEFPGNKSAGMFSFPKVSVTIYLAHRVYSPWQNNFLNKTAIAGIFVNLSLKNIHSANFSQSAMFPPRWLYYSSSLN